jgi:hypothetical protein
MDKMSCMQSERKAELRKDRIVPADSPFALMLLAGAVQ